jgi:hypothetical protein
LRVAGGRQICTLRMVGKPFVSPSSSGRK